MASNKRTIYLGLDYSQFTGGVTEVNRKMQLLDSEFKLAQERARNYGKASDELGLKQEYLAQKISLQKQKVEEAKKAYDAAMSSTTASQKEIDELDKRLLNERTTLEKLNGQLKEANKQVLGFDEANKKLDKSIKSLAVGAAAVTTALVKFSVDAANTADDLKTLSAQTGMTTTEIQRLQYAANFVDVSFDTMSSSITKLETNMNKARNGSKDMTEAFRKLHVKVTDNNGQLKDANQLFLEIIDKLGTVKNETERDTLAMTLFGKSAKELNPLIQAGSDELRKLGDEAERTGKIMSEEDVEAGASMADSMARLNATIQAVNNGLGQALIPVLQTFADILSSIDPKVIEIVALGGAAIALVTKLVIAISVLTTAMVAHNGVQMVFNATALKSIGIIIAIVAALAVLGAIIASIIGKTNDMSKGIDEATKMSQNVGKTINQSVNATYQTGRNASGTDNWQGGKTWVGEEGPELVTLPRGSQITPADQVSGMGEVNNYYITIDAKSVSDFNRVVELAQQQKMATRRV